MTRKLPTHPRHWTATPAQCQRLEPGARIFHLFRAEIGIVTELIANGVAIKWPNNGQPTGLGFVTLCTPGPYHII